MTSFRARALPAVLFALGLGAATNAAAQQQLNVICSAQGEWCNAIATEFQRETGIKVAITPKGSGESIAQLAAEKANPKLDVWFGGTGDPHLQAAEQGLKRGDIIVEINGKPVFQGDRSHFYDQLVDRGLHLGVGGVEQRFAAGLLVAPGNERVERQRIGVGDRVLLLDQDAEHAGFEQREGG